MKVALFDVCHTLVDTTTVREFTEDYLLSKKHNPSFRIMSWVRHIIWKILRRLGLVSDEQYRQHFSFLFSGYSVVEVASVAERYAVHLHDILKPQSIAELKRLQQEGYAIYLVSAGYDVYLLPFAKSLGVGLVSSNLEQQNDVYTGRLDGVDCYGQGKVEKTLAAITETVDWQSSISFGDTTSDIAILSIAGTPVAVDPDNELRSYAQQHGWRIIEHR